KAKGTGKWTSQVAMDLQAPIPSIDSAVSMRDLSKYKQLREQAATLYSKEEPQLNVNTDEFIAALEQSFYFSMIITYAQGMHLLSRASDEYNYDLKLDEIAKIWRGGCIIRSLFLNDIFSAYNKDAKLQHLLLDSNVHNLVSDTVKGARTVLSATISAGIAAPAYTASLSYFDNFRNKRMPSNLTQAQRDYFGAHTYELIGKEGVFHTQWTAKSPD
ncbi:MAG: NADP-dependent phosphogluconate dehydrogenase, partial [Mucilaginibacter sp.]